MDFRATPANVVTLLLAAFAVWVLHALSKRRLDSNLPLLFYCALIAYMNFSDREVNRYLFAGGLLLALLLRFEFMNLPFTRLILALEILFVTGIAGKFVSDILGLGLAF